MSDVLRAALEAYLRLEAPRSRSRASKQRERAAMVNGRGQLLVLGGSVDTSDREQGLELGPSGQAPPQSLYGSDRSAEVNALFSALRADSDVLAHAHCCQNDGGLCFIQAPDLDEAALRTYVIEPSVGLYAASATSEAFDGEAFSVMFDRVFGALRASATSRRVLTPVLGLEMTSRIELEPDVTIRAPSEDESVEWSRDPSLERSLLRDLLTCRCVVEVNYSGVWPPVRHAAGQPLDVSTFDALGVEGALERSQDTVALLRIVTGRALPLIYTEEQIVALPWVTNRFFHRPMLADVRRRHDWSPLWVRLVDAEPMTDLEGEMFRELWTALKKCASPFLSRAVRLFTLERDYVNLYRIFEVLQDTGADLKMWESKSEMGRFTQTTNSPDAIGDAWARHGRRVPAPAAPMAWKEADALIRKLIIGVVRSNAAAL